MPNNQYRYSEPVVIRKWNGGSITVKVGYVVEHPERHSIVLEKVWATGKQQFNVKDATDWQKIVQTVARLWPELEEVASPTEIGSALAKVTRETKLLDLISQNPDFIKAVPENINILSLPDDQKSALTKLLEAGSGIAGSIIERLSKEPVNDLVDFVKILESYRLTTINALVTHVTTRLGFIDTFEKVIHNDDSYERQGKDSVHNLLKANIWMLDRNYSILHDDVTLKTIIAEQWEQEYSGGDAQRRPDFLCLTNESWNQELLVVIEIKRPSVKLKMEHMTQVMKYKHLLQTYSGKTYRDFKCYLIGREVSADLKSNDLSSSGFNIKTYTDFISDARSFYSDYLETIKSEDYAV